MGGGCGTAPQEDHRPSLTNKCLPRQEAEQEAHCLFANVHIVYNNPDLYRELRATFQQNADLYRSMWGETEDKATGSLKTLDVSRELGQVACPTLITYGQHDIVQKATAERWGRRAKARDVRMVLGVAHYPFEEAPTEYSRILREFLRAHDGA